MTDEERALRSALAKLAHDFNNRMSAILLCATELIAELPADTEPALLATEIGEAACEVADVCDQLMACARPANDARGLAGLVMAVTG